MCLICLPGIFPILKVVDVHPVPIRMSTLARCPVCMTMRADLVRCPRCRNVGYCSSSLNIVSTNMYSHSYIACHDFVFQLLCHCSGGSLLMCPFQVLATSKQMLIGMNSGAQSR